MDMLKADPRAQLGPTLRRLRKRRGLTLRQVGDHTGLAVSSLSKIENNQVSPTYDSLLKLKNCLGLDLSQLFDPDSAESTAGRRTVTPRGQGVRYDTPQYEFEVLCTDVTKKLFFPFVATLKAHSLTEFGRLAKHQGEEFIYVLSGEVAVHTEHYAPAMLKPGDSCYLDSSMGHGCIAVGDAASRILWVTSTNGFDDAA